ncbi:insecticidal delta-endotoxin Cry8Ea1 family protein, partial [Bacillus cereus]|uniref:insecticidal delta-endotoxin Cry8Ea1 family protein n=1 Tax=Bacillus cereus TaxID=1396 RepID=UPI0011555C48
MRGLPPLRNAIILGTKIATVLIGAAFPPLKIPGQILSAVLPYLWPEQTGDPGTPEAQFTWEQMMTAVEELIDQKIDTLVKSRAIETLQILQSRVRDYQQGLCNLKQDPNNEAYKAELRDAFDD